MAATSESVRQLREALAEASLSQDWAPVTRAAIEAFTQAKSGVEVKQIAGLPGMVDGFLGEADVGTSVANALVDRAASFTGPSDSAEACSWLLRAAAFRPLGCVAPELVRPRFLPKAEVVEVLANARQPFEAWLRSEAPELRSSAALALCWSNQPSLGTWLQLAKAEQDAVVRASLLLLLAAHAHLATGEQREHLGELARGSAKGKASPLTFSACVLASRLGALDATLSKAFTQHVMKGTATPSEWGWYGADSKPIKTSVAALSVLRWVELEDATPLVEGLLKAKRPKAKGDLLQLADALTWSVFEARGVAVPQTGVVAAGLDPLQRRVIEALAEPAFKGLVPTRLGLPGHSNHELLDFLGASDLNWSPRPLGADDRPHFSVLAARVASGDVKEKVALNAILESGSPEEAVRLACCQSSATGATAEALGAELDAPKLDELCLAVVDAAAKSGAKVQELLGGFLDPRGNEPYADHKQWANKPVVACALLDRTKGAPTEALLQFLADAIGAARSAEPLISRVRKLNPTTRSELLGRLKASGNTLPFLSLQVDPATVSKLVRFAIGPWASTQGTRVEDALVSMGDAVLALIDQVEPPTPEQRSMISELHARVRARITK